MVKEKEKIAREKSWIFENEVFRSRIEDLINIKMTMLSAEQWKLLGQEKDGSLLFGWIEEVSSENVLSSYSVIGQYDRTNDKLQVNLIVEFFEFFHLN